jgi:hypothetical protein
LKLTYFFSKKIRVITNCRIEIIRVENRISREIVVLNSSRPCCIKYEWIEKAKIPLSARIKEKISPARVFSYIRINPYKTKNRIGRWRSKNVVIPPGNPKQFPFLPVGRIDFVGD